MRLFKRSWTLATSTTKDTLVKATLTRGAVSTYFSAFHALAVGFVVALIFAFPGYAQEPAQTVDPKIAAALKEVSSARIQANIEKLVSFGTRSTLSAQDPTSIAAGRRHRGCP
jgi:hypothetical protein